jgi:hypothetical protein
MRVDLTTGYHESRRSSRQYPGGRHAATRQAPGFPAELERRSRSGSSTTTSRSLYPVFLMVPLDRARQWVTGARLYAQGKKTEGGTGAMVARTYPIMFSHRDDDSGPSALVPHTRAPGRRCARFKA